MSNTGANTSSEEKLPEQNLSQSLQKEHSPDPTLISDIQVPELGGNEFLQFGGTQIMVICYMAVTMKMFQYDSHCTTKMELG